MKWRVKQAGDRSWHTHLKWLKPGLGVKRWLLLLTLGIGLLSLGGASALRAFYPLPQYFHYLTLQFLPRAVRVILFLFLGIGSIVVAILGFNRAVLEPFIEGLSILPRRDRITRSAVGGVVDDIVSANGGIFSGVTVSQNGITTDIYGLGIGEKAKAGTVTFV